MKGLMKYLFALLLPLLFSACQTEKPTDQKMSVRMMDSEMARFPELWMVDNISRPFWGYTHGMIALASLDMYEYTGDKKYYDYVEAYTDTLIKTDGFVVTYDSTKYNIDMINPGKILFPMYELTQDQRFLDAATTLRKSMINHPKTTEGGFWHKKRYTNQMWLDGLYMGSPFLAEYAQVFKEPELFDQVATQVKLIDKYLYDSETSLYYHGWDEMKLMHWSDSVTGTSKNFWGRAVGWFAMSLVDMLDYFPEDHPDRAVIIEVLNKVAVGIKNYQDETSGVWYQVLDQGTREGNYLESTCSAMFTYSLLKGVRKGYLDESYMAVAKKGYAGILKEFIRENEDGTISLTKCCHVAGLGGKNMRDGSFEYYINEKRGDDDPKGIGPFIWASMEMETLK